MMWTHSISREKRSLTSNRNTSQNTAAKRDNSSEYGCTLATNIHYPRSITWAEATPSQRSQQETAKPDVSQATSRLPPDPECYQQNEDQGRGAAAFDITRHSNIAEAWGRQNARKEEAGRKVNRCEDCRLTKQKRVCLFDLLIQRPTLKSIVVSTGAYAQFREQRGL